MESRKQFAKTETMSDDKSENLTCDLCDLFARSRKYLNVHMLRYHMDLEQLDGNISLNSTDVEEHKKDTTTETDILETEADFTINFEEGKTKEEVERELEKLWDSNLKDGLGWDTIEKCNTYVIIHIKLDEGETMNKL